MDGKDILILVSRWVHILSAVVAIGGAFFMRFVLMPSAKETLTDEQHAALREKVIGRWKRVVMIVIGLLFITGIVNFVWVGMPKSKLDGASSYHAIFGVKLLLAFGIFYLASALTGRSKATEGLRAQSSRWLGIVVILGVLVIVLGGILNRLG